MKKALIVTCMLATVMTGRGLAQDPQTSLWEAAIQGDSAMAAKAISDGAKVDSMDTRTSENGRRPLNWAAYHGHVPVIKLLLARGASINLTNRTGFTPLHHAAEMGNREAAALLIAAGADRKLRNVAGLTAAEVADAREHPDVAALITKP